MAKAQTPKASTQKKKPAHTYTIDFSKPAEDKIFDGAAFEKYLHDHLKSSSTGGKPGVLGTAVTITRIGEGKITVTSTGEMSKRYMKFLTKRFLKKSSLRDFIRVLSTSKDTYELKFFNIQAEDFEAEEEEGEEMEV